MICNDWAVALDAKRRSQEVSLPSPHDVVQSIKAARCVVGQINALSRYVRRCLD